MSAWPCSALPQGWTYLFELEDDPTIDDMPASPSSIGVGYANANSYFLGNSALNAVTSTSFQVCAGDRNGDNDN